MLNSILAMLSDVDSQPIVSVSHLPSNDSTCRPFQMLVSSHQSGINIALVTLSARLVEVFTGDSASGTRGAVCITGGLVSEIGIIG